MPPTKGYNCDQCNQYGEQPSPHVKEPPGWWVIWQLEDNKDWNNASIRKGTFCSITCVIGWSKEASDAECD